MRGTGGTAGGMKIALIGFMGAGKSMAGRILAARLGLAFADLDREIEKAAGRSVPAIFESDGEAGFRLLECRCLRDFVRERDGFVLACGGGIILLPENRDLLKNECVTVWIDVPREELLGRLEASGGGRPLLAGGAAARKAADLLEARLPLYRECAAVTYSWKEGETAAETASRIASMLGSGV